MSLITQMVDASITLLGSGYLVALVVIAVIVIILLASNVGKHVILIVLVPLIVSLAVYSSQYINIPNWIGIVIWMVMGILMAGVFWLFLR